MNLKKYRVLILTGSKPRHLFFVSTVSKFFKIGAIICENKNSYISANNGINSVAKKHNINLTSYENKYFKTTNLIFSKHPNLKIEEGEINSKHVIDWSKTIDYDFIAVFGSGILKESWFKDQSKPIINLHLGLSPVYRGSATLFWPFYNEDLDNLGTTIHLVDAGIDTGPIIDIVKLDNYFNTNYYQITNRLIKKSIKKYPKIVKKFLTGKKYLIPQDQNQQKYYYKKSDLTDFHLKKVIEKYGK
jgi:folate-dependent phosphoribosylglycinamide formyltransferase PurN